MTVSREKGQASGSTCRGWRDNSGRKPLQMEKFLEDENALRGLILRHQRKILALALYSTGCDLDKAYEIAVSAFVSTIRSQPALRGKMSLLRMLIRFALDEVYRFEGILSSEPVVPSTGSPAKDEVRRAVREALLALPLEVRVHLVLRDQMNLPYEDIAAILKIPQHNAKTLVVRGRIQLRDKVRAIVSHWEAP